MVRLHFLLYFICVISVPSFSSVIRLHTHSPEGKIFSYFPLLTNTLKFHVKSDRDADVILSTSYTPEDPFYEFAIGAWEDKAAVFWGSKQGKEDWLGTYNGSLLNENEFRLFWINLDHVEQKVTLGTGRDKVLIQYYDPHFVNMTTFGVTSARGAYGEWIIDYENNFAKGNNKIKDSICLQVESENNKVDGRIRL